MSKRPLKAFIALAVVWFLTLGFIRLLQMGQKAAHQMELCMELGQAISSRDHKKVETLLQQGAGPNAADIDDSIILALDHDDPKMVRLLIRYGANPSQSLLSARTVDHARELLALGANPNAHAGLYGETALIDHSTSGSVEIVRFLLAHGGDPRIRNQDGKGIFERVAYAASKHPEQANEYNQVIRMLRDALNSPKVQPNKSE